MLTHRENDAAAKADQLEEFEDDVREQEASFAWHDWWYIIFSKNSWFWWMMMMMMVMLMMVLMMVLLVVLLNPLIAAA